VAEPLGPFFGHIILDVPAAEPALSFQQIAWSLANIIETSTPHFAVGIFGGWGSGKSTLMEAIRNRLELRGDILAVEFNAWRYERESHLIIPLLDSIRSSVWEWSQSAIATVDQRSVARSIAARIGNVVRALVRSTSLEVGLPGAVTLTVDPARALDEMTPRAADEAANPQSLYYGAFQELSGAFKQVSAAGVSRLVVFVDDLDRCMPEHALTVLESMKLFFDIPGFVFVVGLDEHVVESAVRSKFANAASESAELIAQLERDYLKKIFQVPYTLPTMVAGQLNDLIWWIERHSELSDVQRQDLRDRVSRYLGYVAADGRVNPREVKRFINAYTISRMIRPDLDANVILALQTLAFRPDWERLYEEVILAEPDVAGTIIEQFRVGDDRAFDDLWPSLGVLPLELSAYLRSPEGQALAAPDLDRYVSFLETTHSSQSWLADAIRAVGALRRGARRVETDVDQLGRGSAPQIAAELSDAVNRLTRLTSQFDTAIQLDATLQGLHRLISQLARTPDADVQDVGDAAGLPPVRTDGWLVEFRRSIDQLQQELRIVRRSSTFVY
jgi:hypothetical protein